MVLIHMYAIIMIICHLSPIENSSFIFVNVLIFSIKAVFHVKI